MTAIIVQRSDGRWQITGRSGHWPTFVFKSGTTQSQANLLARFLNNDLQQRPTTRESLRRLSFAENGDMMRIKSKVKEALDALW
jgi:hypothetical protein